jgi:hypothetical protein
MLFFQLIPISSFIAEEVRETLKSPKYGHPAHLEVATGYGPCRSCLRMFAEGQEKRILFTYDPFDGIDPYPSPGPVFIHEQPCRPFSANDEFPEELRRIPLVLENFGENRLLLHEDRFSDGKVENRVEDILADERVKYIHLRNGEAGCFIARIERRMRGA